MFQKNIIFYIQTIMFENYQKHVLVNDTPNCIMILTIVRLIVLICVYVNIVFYNVYTIFEF